MSWQMLLAINLVAATIREYLNKKIANKINPFTALFYIVLFCQIWLWLGFTITYGRWPGFDLTAALTGVILVIGFSAYFAALKINLSQTILFQTYSILVTIILSAIYLGEAKYFDMTTVTGLKVISGIVLAFAALWYLLHSGNKKEERLEKKWFFYMLIVISFLGTGSFFSVSFLAKYTSYELLLNQGNAMIPVFFILSLVKGGGVNVGRKNIYLMVINSVFSSIAVVAFYNALKLVSVAKFYPLQQVLLVIATIFTGVVFYQEKSILTGKHLIGMILGLSGILLLVTS